MVTSDSSSSNRTISGILPATRSWNSNLFYTNLSEHFPISRVSQEPGNNCFNAIKSHITHRFWFPFWNGLKECNCSLRTAIPQPVPEIPTEHQLSSWHRREQVLSLTQLMSSTKYTFLPIICPYVALDTIKSEGVDSITDDSWLSKIQKILVICLRVEKKCQK